MKAGRPGLYRPEYAEQALKLCKLGLIDAELAVFFEVNEVTINRWKKAHPEFCKALKKGKTVADAEVAEKLFQRAVGYSHPDVHISNYQGVVTITNITKHYPPDTVACIFWLKNRRRMSWVNAPGVGPDGGGLIDPDPDV
jgi:hypothetical protein